MLNSMFYGTPFNNKRRTELDLLHPVQGRGVFFMNRSIKKKKNCCMILLVLQYVHTIQYEHPYRTFLEENPPCVFTFGIQSNPIRVAPKNWKIEPFIIVESFSTYETGTSTICMCQPPFQFCLRNIIPKLTYYLHSI